MQRTSRTIRHLTTNGRLAQDSAAGRRFAALAFLLALLPGCQIFEPRWEPQEPPKPPDEPVEVPTAAEPESDFARAIDLLQDGRLQEAESILSRLQEQRPASKVIGALLEQIRKPADALLPPPYRTVFVDPGQTLSEIAAEELGDPLMFVALARLNEIEVPERLAVGDTLRVPETVGEAGEVDEADETEASPVPAPPEPERELSADDVETVAEYLVLSGQPGQARRMLIDLIGQRDAPMSSRRMLAALTLAEAERLRAAGAPDAAREVLAQTLEVLDDRESFADLIAMRQRLRVDALLEQARAAREQQNLLEAHEIARRAARLAPEDAVAGALAYELRQEIIDRYHNDALVAWRDRDVDRAIRLWQTLLDSVPDFEPAQVYLERAKQLRRRLDRS